MKSLFVAGTGTDLGKTHVACALLEAARAGGLSVDAFKPVVSGFDPDAPDDSDPARLARALGRPEAWTDVSPRRYRAPLAPNIAARLEGDTLQMDDLITDCREWLIGRDVGLALIEGAGGVMSPMTDEATNLDLMVALGLPVLLVAGSYLGTASHLLTALEVLRARGLSIAAIVVSESLDAPDLDQTLGLLRAFEHQATILSAPRAGNWDAGSLVDLLMA
ncbi:dethiobiotin synthase [Caulobacter vibrioides]|uniref:ATP-dependent dethiobiotin synthetase BioD n=2 Tax=Caulobacter vibrioides TaxID=155892 RepID=BIOD_CAUVC|nr:dethiobiotin synthase [Caulobacter vibrioides]YP_002517019.1 dethiobiotin synthetase [Caulobacter vibrioides NA1000]B8GVE1.1 RecName: Full=ATP-dependent dethiobiotin synthetase BioD; AltName: Full=DTB synthetase; Short=DTBS; AltName: Full=Dethiobiotin synthase [Caulobacter vibrioides NA1000]Q9A7Z2.1 RecName: Full=ATP-dependent dethiobiotin synthetase BioD; AltName: Full=DTB synthetase; Short=DTBS; AltName: Full=Dethiobiotin synthase [Caulobacter vibrioides CB15]AAK23554.1 dethiobiotin synthe